MSDLILRSATRTELVRYRAAEAIVDYARRVVQRARAEQTGQDMVEYAGVLVVVAVLIGAVAGVIGGVAGPLVADINKAITSVFSKLP